MCNKTSIFSSDFFIGYVNEVSPSGIRIHLPSVNLMKRFLHNGRFFPGASVGSFVLVEGSNAYAFLVKIISVELPESERKAVSERAFEINETKFHPIAFAEILFSFNMYDFGEKEKTMAYFPDVGAKAYSCSNDVIRKLINFKKRNQICGKLGTLTSNDADFEVSLDSIFGRHCAIVGTTGGGKSWTLARLVELLRERTNNKVILLDATGEYEDTVKYGCVLGEDSYWNYDDFTDLDFCQLFNEASPNTITALCDAIHSLRVKEADREFDGIKAGKKINEVNQLISKNIAALAGKSFAIMDLPQQIRNECVKEEKGIYREDPFKLAYCSHLISRVNLFLGNDVYKKALGIDNKNFKSLQEKLEEFFNSSEKVFRIGFEKLSFEFSIREVIVDLISKHLLVFARNGKFKNSPIVLFIDEAHQFLGKNVLTSDGGNVVALTHVASIAKECRKHGLFLCLSTQMPRDIPSDVFSQIGTFFVHRLINEQDRKSIENACSSATRKALSFLPTLGPGEVLFVSVDLPMSVTLKIERPRVVPCSNTPTLSELVHG